MSKINGLNYLQNKLTRITTGMMRGLLAGTCPSLKRQQYILKLGLYTLLAEECRSQVQSLRFLRDYAEHGLNGTAPVEFYGCPTDPDHPGEFDPYEEMTGLLDAVGGASVLRLSPSLLDFASGLPEVERSTNGRMLARGVVGHFVRDDGHLRPMNTEELARHSERDMLEAIEKTLFLQTYAADMRRVAQLVAARGDLAEILDLLGEGPELPF